MKKISFILFLATIILGCQKDSSSTNRTSSSVNIKYEIISTVNCSADQIMFSNESGAPSQLFNTNIGLTWTKEIVYTNTYRPFTVNVGANLRSNSPGKATSNIYVNDSKKASVTVDYQNIGNGTYMATLTSMYILE
jgi:hypothetical protein